VLNFFFFAGTDIIISILWPKEACCWYLLW